MACPLMRPTAISSSILAQAIGRPASPRPNLRPRSGPRQSSSAGAGFRVPRRTRRLARSRTRSPPRRGVRHRLSSSSNAGFRNCNYG
jgi:hypothetical protein